jgi:hypothetical protein
MKKLRKEPTPIQRFIKQQLRDEYQNFLFDADGITVYSENYEGWGSIQLEYEPEKK